ncbi:hypothetical protein BDW22DRAFT_1433255 [Trametopsis cervina]|nr:hypothetical protein BDW22DRAFT_1433255 [Trametopsis cervina]
MPKQRAEASRTPYIASVNGGRLQNGVVISNSTRSKEKHIQRAIQRVRKMLVHWHEFVDPCTVRHDITLAELDSRRVQTVKAREGYMHDMQQQQHDPSSPWSQLHVDKNGELLAAVFAMRPKNVPKQFELKKSLYHRDDDFMQSWEQSGLRHDGLSGKLLEILEWQTHAYMSMQPAEPNEDVRHGPHYSDLDFYTDNGQYIVLEGEQAEREHMLKAFAKWHDETYGKSENEKDEPESEDEDEIWGEIWRKAQEKAQFEQATARLLPSTIWEPGTDVTRLIDDMFCGPSTAPTFKEPTGVRHLVHAWHAQGHDRTIEGYV